MPVQGPRLQRRCYWLLETEDDIVLVHYLNVDKTKGRADDALSGLDSELARRPGTTITSGVSGVSARCVIGLVVINLPRGLRGGSAPPTFLACQGATPNLTLSSAC